MTGAPSMVDFNVHLVEEPDLEADQSLAAIDVAARAAVLADAARVLGIGRSNVMVLDVDAVGGPAEHLLGSVIDAGHDLTVALDPRRDHAFAQVDRARELGARGIKFHPYTLDLVDDDFGAAVAVATRAAEAGLWIVVCCSWGTARVHAVSGVRLLAALARAQLDAPVIALHAGGAAVLEVMSIATEMPNLLLETSFSIPYWNGSSVETDLAFAMRKLGLDRWMYGSDHPYSSMESSLDEFHAFMIRHGFDDDDAAQVLGETARSRLL